MQRTLPRHKLKDTPLVHVLAQVRFTPVFGLKDRIQAVQARLRACDFPRYDQTTIQNLVIEAGGQAMRLDPVARYDFLNRDKTEGVVLTSDFVLVHTNKYSTYEEFDNRLRQVLTIVNAEVTPDLVERIGIRYVDLVRLDPGESFTQYLAPGLLGYAFESTQASLEIEGAASRMESIAKTASGSQLAVRCFQRADGTILPPDLWPTVLNYEGRTIPAGELVTILDIDHSSTQPVDFEVDPVADALAALHDKTDITFRGAVTPYALQKWGQEILS